MSGRHSQRKGADGERELAAVLREYGYDMERGGSMSYSRTACPPSSIEGTGSRGL